MQVLTKKHACNTGQRRKNANLVHYDKATASLYSHILKVLDGFPPLMPNTLAHILAPSFALILNSYIINLS